MINEWRKNKKNPAEKMPDEIWGAIFNFIETTKFPENEILKEIGIKPARLNNKRQSLGLAETSQKSITTKAGLKTTDETKLTQFEITRPDGATHNTEQNIYIPLPPLSVVRHTPHTIHTFFIHHKILLAENPRELYHSE